MATAIGDLVARLRMDARGFTGAASNARGSLRSFALAGAVAGAAASVVAAGISRIAYAFKNAATAGADFNASMRTSTAIMNVTASQTKAMEQAAFATAKTTGRSASDMARSYYYLASAGMNVEQSMAALPAVARFATAGNFDMARATELAAGAQSTLGLRVKDPIKNLANLVSVTDVLVAANILAQASTEEFSEALTTKSGAALRAVNKDIEEGVAVLAVLASQNVRGAEAGTQLGIIMRDLQTKAITNREAFRQAGVEVYRFGKMLHIADIIDSLTASLAGMGDEARRMQLLKLGFSDRSLGSLQILLGTGEQIRENDAMLRGAGGKTAEVAAKSMGLIGTAWNSFSASLTQLGSGISKAVGPAIATILVGLAAVVDGVTWLGGKLADWGGSLFPGLKDLDSELLKEMRGEVEQTTPSVKTLGKTMNTAFSDASRHVRAARMELEQYRDSLTTDTANFYYKPISELTKKYREASEASRGAALGLTDWQVAINSLQDRTGPSYMADAQRNLVKAAQDAQKWESSANATKWIDDTNERIWQLRTGVDDFAASFSNIASAPGVTPEQLARMKEMYSRFRELEKTQELKEFGKGITESVATPFERYREELAKLDQLRKLGEAGGGISGETYRRRLLEIKGDLSPTSEMRYSGAMELGSAEAYSTIVNSGRNADKIAKDQLATQRASLGVLQAVNRKLGVESEEGI